MIHVEYRRIGPVVLAITVRDDGTVRTALGFTQLHALRRLIS